MPIPPTSSTVLRIECEGTSQPLGTSGQSFGSGSAIASVRSTMRRSVPRVRGGQGLRRHEGVVEVRPLPLVAVPGDVVDGDLVLAPEQDQPVPVALQEGEHLLERGHPLLARVEGRQRGGVVHEEEDDGTLARGRREGAPSPGSAGPAWSARASRAGSIADR